MNPKKPKRCGAIYMDDGGYRHECFQDKGHKGDCTCGAKKGCKFHWNRRTRK